MAKRAREYEQDIDKLNSDITKLQREKSELESELKRIRSKEDAIIGALTEAQTSAARTMDDAKTRAEMIIQETEKRAQETLESLESNIAEANERAALIIENAENEAMRKVKSIEEIELSYRQRAATLKENISKAAQQAREFAEQFAELFDLMKAETDMMIDTSSVEAATSEAPTPETEVEFEPAPEVEPDKEYAAPAQSREVPKGVAETEEVLAGNNLFAQQEQQAEQGSAPDEYNDAGELMHNIYNLRDNGKTGSEEEALLDEDYSGDDEPHEEDDKLWTVDEITNKDAAAGEESNSLAIFENGVVELDALIDDILKDD